MCRKADILASTTTNTTMVTPTKVKYQSRHQQPHHHRGKGWTPPPPPASQKQYQSKHSNSPQPPHYNYSSNSGASTPTSRESPCFAGSKCFEPPTPDSLPKPPTSWTPTKPVAKKQLNFGTTSDVEVANQHLKMLLNVQA